MKLKIEIFGITSPSKMELEKVNKTYNITKVPKVIITLVSEFIAIKINKSKNTGEGYARDIKQFFCKDIDTITLGDLRSVNLLHAQQYILKLKDKGLSSATINRKISALSSLYKWLLKFQDNESGKFLLQYNPFGNLKEEKPTVENKEAVFLSKEEVQKMLEVLNMNDVVDIRNKAILMFAITTGLRKSEIMNVKINDMTTKNGYEIANVIRKGGESDTVKLQPKVKQQILDYLKRTNRNEKSKGYLFIGLSYNGNNAEKLNPKSLSEIVKDISKRTDIKKDVNFHSLRHTAITLALEGGASIEKVRDFACHKNISTTNRYIHSLDKLKNNAGDGINI